MHRPICLALLSALPTTAFAQQSKPTAAWQEFLRDQGSSWSVSWNPATGTPTVVGAGLKVSGPLESLARSRPHAEATLARFAGLLGRGTSTFVEVDASVIRHLHYFVYGQRFRGLEVRGGRADVRIHDRGVVAMFGSDAVAIPAGFDIRPGITAAAARTAAETEILGQAGKAGLATRLIIHAEPQGKAPTRPTLAWEVELNQLPEEHVAGKVFIDAKTGKMLEFENGIVSCGSCGKTHLPNSGHSDAVARLGRARNARAALVAAAPPHNAAPRMSLDGTVMAWTNLGHLPTDSLTNVPVAFAQVSSSAGSTTTDAFGKFSIPYPGTAGVVVTAILAGKHMKRIAVQTGSQLTASATISPAAAGLIQFGSAGMPESDRSQTTTYHFVNEITEYIQGLVPNKPTEFARLDQMQPRVNISSSCNAFYQGYTINFYNASSTCNMTAFETVVMHEWGHGLDDAFGGIVFTDGLSEGWADVVAILRSQQPILGPGFYKTQNPNYVRTATNNRTYPGGGGTHQQGEVWMGWVWDVRTNLAATKGVPAAQLLTENMVIPTIVANAPNLQRQVLEVFLLDDDDGSLLNGTPNYSSLEAACIKRAISYPKIATGILTHTPLGSSDQQLAPRPVVVKATAITGSMAKIELVYDAGTGTVREEMVPTGNLDEWIALLPGVLSPKAVTYAIEATHSTAKVLRVPEVGFYEYAIGQEDVFFFDDFEKVQSGWISGGRASDFARGTPAGASGSVWNTSWADPTGAFSGTFAWGNDLNGAYAPSMDAFLRTPILDLTGKTAVRLRFQRWLQVQEGSYDQARLKLNNTVLWQNDANAHHLDAGWSKVDMRLTSADNNPSVQLEWSLTTDGGMELAGWNIDDVTLYSFQAIAPPAMTLEIQPSTVKLGQQSTLRVQGTASAPILILVSATPGPFTIPGLPTLQVGPGFVPVVAVLDASGKMALNFTAPTIQSATGQLTYVHALEQTSPTTITGSNGGVVLWGR